MTDAATREAAGERETTRGAPVMRPPTDIYETDTALVLLMEMPGVAVEAANVTVENQELTVSASAQPTTPTGYTQTHEEFADVHYERAFTLSDAVDSEHIQAAMKDGVLKLTLPKASAAVPRRIKIRDGSIRSS